MYLNIVIMLISQLYVYLIKHVALFNSFMNNIFQTSALYLALLYSVSQHGLL